jgi:hypothetical protein
LSFNGVRHGVYPALRSPAFLISSVKMGLAH